MNLKKILKIKKNKYKCSGTGMIALDIVINHTSNSIPFFLTGGSCGNVLTILSYLGWESYPIARLKNDLISTYLINDLKKDKINTDLLLINNFGSTPLVIEKIIATGSGNPKHSYILKCPTCGTWYPRYRPIPLKNTVDIIKRMPRVHIFYMDRLNKSSLELMHAAKKQGAKIMFEPSSISDLSIFKECLLKVDILKYANPKLKNIKEITDSINIPLEIETHSSSGLRYRVMNTFSVKRKWKHVKAFQVYDLIDAAGSGDWCSAGLLHVLRKNSEYSLINIEEIETALLFGQALAALNCRFEGARGSMYVLEKENFLFHLQEIIAGKSKLSKIHPKTGYSFLKQGIEMFCKSCK